MVVLACFGHWYGSAIYASPVLLLAGLILVDKHRHHDDEDDLDRDLEFDLDALDV